eukprot:SAG25_NODE_284_length_10400_cov_5.110475_11_plen_99_part_00
MSPGVWRGRRAVHVPIVSCRRQAGSTVEMGRVNGNLNLTRAIGAIGHARVEAPRLFCGRLACLGNAAAAAAAARLPALPLARSLRLSASRGWLCVPDT